MKLAQLKQLDRLASDRPWEEDIGVPPQAKIKFPDGGSYEIRDVVYKLGANTRLTARVRNCLPEMITAIEAAIDFCDGHISIDDLRAAVADFRDD